MTEPRCPSCPEPTYDRVTWIEVNDGPDLPKKACRARCYTCELERPEVPPDA